MDYVFGLDIRDLFAMVRLFGKNYVRALFSLDIRDRFMGYEASRRNRGHKIIS
jgi:hypothetical protein